MLSIRSNHYALIAQNNLAKSQAALGQAIERLSSGKRINSAKDDPAGQAIANRMTANINGLTQASRNANDGISMAQTAEGALDEINYNLQRVRELTVQAVTGTNSKEDRQSIQNEIDERLKEIQRISEQTHFNGINLLGSDAKEIAIQVGAHDGQTISIKFSAMNLGTLNLSDFNVAATDDLAATENPLARLDTALQQVGDLRSHLGAIQNRFESVINTNTNMVTNLSAARSRIEDADYAAEVSNMIRAQIQQQVGVMVLAQANQMPQLVLKLLRDSLNN